MDSSRAPLTSVRLTIGPFEIALMNLNKVELGSALTDFLTVAESNHKQISELIQKYGGLIPKPVFEGQPADKREAPRGLSISEQVRKSGRKKGTEIALVVAHYLFKEQDLRVVNTRDVENGFDEARLPKLSNANATINSLVSTGKMRSSGEKDGLKGYSITQTGEQEVEGWLADDNQSKDSYVPNEL